VLAVDWLDWQLRADSNGRVCATPRWTIDRQER
jgi:hypothetical protein